MTLKQLEYFVSVANNLSFTAAAKKCFVSQAAITQQIRLLEEDLGVQLFYRTKKRVELTPAGQTYLRDAMHMLEYAGNALHRAKEASRGVTGSLTIGIIKGYEYSDISTRIRAFHKSYPDIRINFIRDHMHSLIDRLNKKEFDIILTLTPFQFDSEEIQYKPLREYPMYAVLYKDHPLARMRTLRYTDLKKEDFIIIEPESRSSEEAEEVILCYERGGFIPNIICHETDLQTMLLRISVGLGVGILPEYCVTHFMNSDDLIIRPLQNKHKKNEVMEFGAAWHKNETNPVIKYLLEFL